MDKVTKLFAITIDRMSGGQGTGGNCKVVAMHMDGSIIYDIAVIQKYIKTDGKIFSNIYAKYPDIGIGELIEITINDINTDVSENHNYYVYYDLIKSVGYAVIDIPNFIIDVDDYIDLIALYRYIKEESYIQSLMDKSFFLCDGSVLYGLFRLNDNRVEPIKGKHTYSFKYNPNVIISDNLLPIAYIIVHPKEKLKSYDCSTRAQLIETLKNYVDLRTDLNLLKKIDKEINEINDGCDALGLIRLKRASQYINQLSYTFEEIQNICQRSEPWSQVINSIVEKEKDVFKRVAITEVESQLKDIKEQISNEKAALYKTANEVNSNLERKKLLENDIIHIQNNKESLVLNLKILAGVDEGASNCKEIQHDRLYEVTMSDHEETYEDFYEFHDQLAQVSREKVIDKDLYHDSLKILKDNRFLVANNALFVKNIISHLGKTKVILQNAEADWLKFSHWQGNGLLDFVKQANEDGSRKFFYVLQDFNIASFECYGKPILDIANKIRTKLPQTDFTYPDNVFIIVIKTDENIEDFGFPLNESTFKSWSFLPVLENTPLLSFPISERINISKLNNTNKDYKDSYFI